MSIPGPYLTTVAYTTTLPNPTNWSVKNIIGGNAQDTLRGTRRTDILFRKNVFELVFDTLLDTDYDALIQLYRNHKDSGAAVLFTWAKWGALANSSPCDLDIDTRDFKGGSGLTGYYSTVTVTLTDRFTRMG